MPLFQVINHNPNTKILIWKITETYEELFNKMLLTEKSQFRLDGMKSEVHKKGFLAIRKLLEIENYTDFDLTYDSFGKPHLPDNKHISISHSHEFATIIISDEMVGIDIELQRDKAIVIADKFVNDFEFSYLNKEDLKDYIKKLTVIWGAKESIFKIENEEGISFKDHVFVNQFNENQTVALLKINNIIKEFPIHLIEIENFILVYAFRK